jgi:hypothetical protein
VGAAVVGLAWLFLGNHGNSGASSSLASLGQAPGIAPPAYAYLDSASVALYLGQLEGGIAKSEQLTQQLTQGRSAGVSAGGLSLGGQTGSSSSAERVVSPTATARFYQLLDLLGRDGYLHTIDAAAKPSEIVRAFAGVPEGSFVRLEDCTVRLPSYVQLLQLFRPSTGSASASSENQGPGGLPPVAFDALQSALHSAGQKQRPTPRNAFGQAAVAFAPSLIRHLRQTVGPNDYRPHGVDLLFPIRLGDLSAEQSLLAGPVTVVGKLVRAVRKRGDEYVDTASLATFGELVNYSSRELNADAVVVSPGAVILPIAIYK